jgi:hypothetical protein
MILSFKSQFIKPILVWSKIHTIREDKTNRWKPGRKIDFFTGRYTSKDRRRFAPTLECVSTQEIVILNMFNDRQVFVGCVNGENRNKLSESQIKKLALNDGFKNVDEFFLFFDQTDFKGKIIHWTDFKY